MSSANNHPDDYGAINTAAGTVPLMWPMIEVYGTFDTRGMDLEYETHPPLPEPREEKKSKSKWLEKQLKRKGWT